MQAFDQATKEIQTTDIDFPLMLRYESTGTTIEFETGRGAPDEILLYVEKGQAGRVWSEYPPVINTVSFKVLGQDIDSVTKLDQTAVFYATTRNSNFRADTPWNRKHKGAVLLTAEDFEQWDQWKSVHGLDNFRGSVTITTSEDYDETLQPSDRFKEEIGLVSKQFTAVFFYKSFSFSGELNNCRFWSK
jgi:hypothetical protein